MSHAARLLVRRGVDVRRTRRQQRSERGDPFAKIERAADQAAAEVLEEDRLLREFGILSEHGRSR
jgi:fructose-1,6-bisphosphatase/inositol monophosphatase family enzyme